MNRLLITLLLCIPAHADEPKKPEPPKHECQGQYTMYTHPDAKCREQLLQEYKALITEFLKQHPPTKGERDEPISRSNHATSHNDSQ